MFSDRLRKVRKLAKLTQDEFASAISITEEYLDLLEENHMWPTKEEFDTIASRFGINEDWLRTGEGKIYISDESTQNTENAIPKRAEDASIYRFRNGIAMNNNDILKALTDVMDLKRNESGKGIGYAERLESESVFNELLYSYRGANLSTRMVDKIQEAAFVMVGDERDIMYQYGMRDAFRLIFQTLTFGENFSVNNLAEQR